MNMMNKPGIWSQIAYGSSFDTGLEQKQVKFKLFFGSTPCIFLLFEHLLV